MNDRIKELWIESGGQYNKGNQHTWPEYTIDNPEKFAKLIVWECIETLGEMDVEYTSIFQQHLMYRFGLK